MKKIYFFLAILLVSVTSIAQVFNPQKIDSIIDSKVGEDDPGIMVGIVKEGAIIYEKYRGLANLQHQVQTTSKTRSNIASTAKQFTALMILDLAMKEKLSLEDDIRKYLSSLYPNVQETIKIRHLINHTSGIRDYVELMSLQNNVWWKQFGLDNDDVMELLEKQNDLGFAPGSQYSYSNSNYNILTKVIEKISGESFNEYSKQFFQNLGMNETSFVERYMGVIPNRADPYSDWGRGEWWQTPTVTKTNGEGFLFTTLKDQLIYEQAIQNAEKDNNLLLLKSQQPIPNSEKTEYGFGLKLTNQLQRNAVHHDGVTYSYHSQMIRFPEEKLSIFILSNNGNIRSDLIAKEIAALFLPEIPQETTYDEQWYKVNPTSKKQSIIGQYYSSKGSLVRIVDEEGKIYFKQGKYFSVELIPEKGNVYYPDYNQEEKLVFYKDEMVLYYPDGSTSVFKRSTIKLATLSDIKNYQGTYYNTELDLSFELKLINNNQLELQFSNDNEGKEVVVYNRNESLAGDNYKMKAQRDSSGAIVDILLSFDRAKNMTFMKKQN